MLPFKFLFTLVSNFSECITELSDRSFLLYAWTTECYAVIVKMNNYILCIAGILTSAL